MPASISAASSSGDDDAGPIVATIFVRRTCMLSAACETRGKALQPGKTAWSPSWSSIRSSWLYFAVRSERAGAPVLIWPLFVATAMSAIVASSVSPDRCEMTVA